MAAGIEERHSRACRTRKGGRCDCEPTYRVRIRLQGRDPVVRTFPSVAEAKGADHRAAARTAAAAPHEDRTTRR